MGYRSANPIRCNFTYDDYVYELIKVYKAHSDGIQRYVNIFDSAGTSEVAIYHFVSGYQIGWHYHRIQVDHVFVVTGTFFVGIWDGIEEGKVEWIELSEMTSKTMLIPARTWHAFKVGNSQCIVAFKYTPGYETTGSDFVSAESLLIEAPPISQDKCDLPLV